MRPEFHRHRNAGFVLPTAIFLLVVMAGLAAFLVQISVASQVGAAQDLQGARAYQVARTGIEAGLYSLSLGTCNTMTMGGVTGFSGFKVTWACSGTNFNEGGVARTIYQITSTACITTGASCPSSTAAEIASPDYVERQLVVTTEK